MNRGPFKFQKCGGEITLFYFFLQGARRGKILHTELRNFNEAKAVCAQNGTTIATVLDGQQIEEAADAAQ